MYHVCPSQSSNCVCLPGSFDLHVCPGYSIPYLEKYILPWLWVPFLPIHSLPWRCPKLVRGTSVPTFHRELPPLASNIRKGLFYHVIGHRGWFSEISQKVP